MKDAHCDVVVIGGGIAGIPLAAHLSRDLRVQVLERESQPGYHATGRSAAIFSEIYGNAPIRALTRASRSFFFDPPDDFTDVPLLRPRGSLYIARHDQRRQLEAFTGKADIARATRYLSASEARALSPALREDYLLAAIHEPDASDLDVHAILGGYLRRLRRNDGQLVTGAEVTGIDSNAGDWCVHTRAGTFRAPVIVNAAGAWVDEIAAMAGAGRIGIQPLRRTAALIDAPAWTSVETWPLTIDIEERFYFKPDAGKVLLSGAEESPSPPCDAAADDLELAVAVHRIEQATTLHVTHVGQKWAGLRSFVADRSPVVGFDPVLPGFFWLAALGGYGIQTAPAVASLAAALVCQRRPSQELLGSGLEPASIAPQRLRAA